MKFRNFIAPYHQSYSERLSGYSLRGLDGHGQFLEGITFTRRAPYKHLDDKRYGYFFFFTK